VTDYARVVGVPGLAPQRAAQLVAHIERGNAVPGRRPVEPTTARCAAVLLAVAGEDLSTPMALAQATALSEQPDLGPALLQLHAAFQALSALSEAQTARLRLNGSPLGTALRGVEQEAARLRRRLEGVA
jgi:hypothetical protein